MVGAKKRGMGFTSRYQQLAGRDTRDTVDYTRKVERNIAAKMSKNLQNYQRNVKMSRQTIHTYIELCRWNIKEGAKLSIPMSKA